VPELAAVALQAARDAPFKKVFGQVLRELRLEREMSQEALASASGLHLNHVSYLERGIKSPSLIAVFQLAGALQIPASDIVTRVEARIAEPVTEL
jgi:transcriptional regulator with XRE-family HTH domain